MVRLFPLEGIDEFRISESVVSTYLPSSLPNPAPRAHFQRFSILCAGWGFLGVVKCV